MRLVGTVVAGTAGELTLALDRLAAWPSHLELTNLNRRLTLAVPDSKAVAAVLGARVIAWTIPAPTTMQTLTGAAGALTLDRLQATP